MVFDMKMSMALVLSTLLLSSCQNAKKETSVFEKKETAVESSKQEETLGKKDSCENDKFVSVLEATQNTDFDAYQLTIFNKKSKDKTIKMVDARPQMSKIVSCNEDYTVVGFPCGGPCYVRVYIFTDKNRPNESYSYAQEVKNSRHLIAHIENEAFGNLMIRNLSNHKTQMLDISDADALNYGQMDAMMMEGSDLILHYKSKNAQEIIKKVSLKKVF
jgi:hypothetical protein